MAVKGCKDCDNSKTLRAASFNLAEKFFPNGLETERRKSLARQIQKLAKRYGDLRVNREREENL